MAAHEKAVVEQAAGIHGLSMAAFARMAILEMCRNMGLDYGPNPSDPTSCPHCGIAEECDHVTGCPNGEVV